MAQRLILDANLFVVLIAGAASFDLMGQHKRLKAYTKKDYGTLVHVVSMFSEVIVTPNVLSETSNLLGQTDEKTRTAIYKAFREVIQITKEIYIESSNASQRSEFVKLGLTDSVLLSLGKEGVLLTADLNLYLAAASAGYKALNFNHFRDSDNFQEFIRNAI